MERTAVNVVIVLALASTAFDLSLALTGAASGVLTIILGVALQNIILDLFAGMLLNLEKPFQRLNWVTVSTGGPGHVW